MAPIGLYKVVRERSALATLTVSSRGVLLICLCVCVSANLRSNIFKTKGDSGSVTIESGQKQSNGDVT